MPRRDKDDCLDVCMLRELTSVMVLSLRGNRRSRSIAKSEQHTPMLRYSFWECSKSQPTPGVSGVLLPERTQTPLQFRH